MNTSIFATENIRKYLCLRLILFLFIPVISGCNITGHIIKKTDRFYDKLGVEEWEYEQDSTIVFWRKIGTGDQKLLLIHGFGPVTELQWKGVVKDLHDDYTMYIPDLVYFGNSTSSTNNYDPRFLSEQIYRSLKIKGVENVVIAGLSYGGMIASLMAKEYPEFTDKLILIDALSKFSDKNHTDSLAQAMGYSDISEILIPEDGKSLKALFKITFHKRNKYPAWLLNKPARMLYADQTEEKRRLLHFLVVHEDYIKTVDFNYDGQVKIIWGSNDLLFPVFIAHKLDEYYKSSSLSIIPKTGHAAPIDSPKKVSAIIKSFMGYTE